MIKRVILAIAMLALLLSISTTLQAELSKADWNVLRSKLVKSLEDKAQATRILGKMKKADSKEAVKFLLSFYGMVYPSVLSENAELIEEAEKHKKYQEMIFKAKSWSQGDVEKLEKINKELRVLEVKQKHNRNFLKKFSDVLGAFKDEDAVDELIKRGLKGKHWFLHEVAAESFAVSKNKKGLERLHELLEDEKIQPEVMHASIRALGGIADFSSIPILTELAQRRRDWETRLEIIIAFKNINDMRCVPGLLACMKECTKRVRYECNGVLMMVTGENFHENLGAWTKWYEKHQSKIQAGTMEMGKGADRDEASAVLYHGIPIVTDRLVFIIDRSGSMKESYVVDGEPGGSGENGVDPSGTTRWEVVRDELIQTIEQLKPEVMFTVITYSSEFEIWSSKMLYANAGSKLSAIEYLNNQEPVGATNIYDPMEKAFVIAGANPIKQAKRKNKKPKGVVSGDPLEKGALIDTIFLLSDGEPNAGRIPNQADILPAVRALNENLNIQINTIYVGKDPSSFMQTLAEENGGVYVQK